MQFETTLNGVWLTLSLLALASTVRSLHRDQLERRGRKSSALQLVGVASVLLALFPYISATDDVLRIASIVPQDKQSESGSDRTGNDALRLFEAADAPLVSLVCRLSITLVFVCLVSVLISTSKSGSFPRRSGRAPPVFRAAI